MIDFFWIASGGRYIEEARKSALSVEKYMPDSRRFLFTPEPTTDFPTTVVPVPPRRSESLGADYSRWFNISLDNLGSRAVYLDCDTSLIATVRELNTILDRFDMAGNEATFYRVGGSVPNIPDCFLEWNFGVCAFRNTPQVKDVFKTMEMSAIEKRDGNLQTPLRRAIWAAPEISIAHLPAEYNFRFNMSCFVHDQVRILHGHEDHEVVAAKVNEKTGRRRWEPLK